MTGTDTGICVLGAGPAGAAMALRLARLGHDVTLVDRHAVPAARIGEALSPGVDAVLDALGIEEEPGLVGVPGAPARVRWRTRAVDAVAATGGRTVDRSAFDAVLRGAATTAGAAFLAGRAARPRPDGDGWAVPLPERVLRCRFLVDATGRRRLLGGRRRHLGPATLALHATWTGAGGRPQSCVDVLPDGWLWAAHLPTGEVRVLALVDPRTMADAPDPERCYHRLVASSGLVTALLDGLRRTGPVQVCDASTYAVDDAVGPTWVRVGEAAFAIDPLSSSGVQAALQSALAAAVVVHTLRDRPGDPAALRYYRDAVAHTSTRHAATAAALYAEHETWADAPFWHDRSRPPTRPTVPTGPALAELLPGPVRLAPGAALEPVPCVVGERVELRRALVHPGLDRPVAFLAGRELAPVLDAVVAAPTLAAAVGAGEADHELAAWLAANDVLVPAGPRARHQPPREPRTHC